MRNSYQLLPWKLGVGRARGFSFSLAIFLYCMLCLQQAKMPLNNKIEIKPISHLVLFLNYYTKE